MIVIAALVVIVAFSVGLGLPLRRVMVRRARERALRENPPKTVCFLVRLPADSSKSAQTMTRVWTRMHHLLAVDDEGMMVKNTDVIHAGLVARGGKPGQKPTVEFVVWAPAEYASRVELQIAEGYDGAEISEIDSEDDPLFAYVQTISEVERAEANAHAAADESEPDTDDDRPDEDMPASQQQAPPPSGSSMTIAPGAFGE
jgi:hypothetical protein